MSNFRLVKLTDPIQFTNVEGGLVPKGEYDNGTTYDVGDSVDYQGSSYVLFASASAGTVPTNTTFWQVLAEKGDTGATGAAGAQGDPGEGVPVGGTSGQVLAKASATDYDTEWVAQTGGGGGAVDSVNGQTGVVVLDADDIDDTSTTNKFATAAQLSNADSAVQPADIADFETTTELNARDTANRNRANHTGSQAISTVTDLQTTLDDKLESADIADFETTTQLNTRDTNNRARANHTGTQLASTISDFSTAADARIAAADTDDLTEGVANLYHTDARAVSAIKSDADWNASDWDTAFGWGNHASEGYITGVDWGDIDGTLANQTDLQSALDSKSATGHTHTESDITDLGNYLENVVEDTTPQLGGDLDVDENDLNNVGNINGGDDSSDGLTIRANQAAFAWANTGDIEILGRMSFNQMTADITGNTNLIRYNPASPVTATVANWVFSGFAFSPIVNYSASRGLSIAPAFAAAQQTRATEGGISDNALGADAGFDAANEHQADHSGAAGLTPNVAGYLARSRVRRINGSAEHTITNYSSFHGFFATLFWNHVGTGYTGTHVANFFANNAVKQAGGEIENLYGLRVLDLTSGDNNWSIWTQKGRARIGDDSSDSFLGFFGVTTVNQQDGTGETTGFTAGSGTGVNDDSTFTGNVGATAYRINDIVKALKNYGLLAA